MCLLKRNVEWGSFIYHKFLLLSGLLLELCSLGCGMLQIFAQSRLLASESIEGRSLLQSDVSLLGGYSI